MEQYSRPATLEDLKMLIEALNAQGADYLLIGGYALFAHGYTFSSQVWREQVGRWTSQWIKNNQAATNVSNQHND